tara:strand:- start:388 stop:711 length:324 start_codon:yes stop_codon:yes gene_type:complete
MNKTEGKDQSLETIEEQLSWNQDKKQILKDLQKKFPKTDESTLYKWIADVEKRMIKEGCKTERQKRELEDREFFLEHRKNLLEAYPKETDIKKKIEIARELKKMSKS